VLALLIIIAAILTYYFWHRSQIYVSTDDAFVEGHIYTISARISGAISGVYVVDNQWVEQNELLVKLDPATYEVAVRNDEAALDLARNQVAQMQADVQVAEAQLRNAEANLQLADEELKRAQELVKSGIQSQQQLDRARATERVARGGVQAAYEQLRKAKAALGTIPESGVHPLIAQRRAELEQAKLDLIYTNIYAPVHGHVTQKSAEVGERIQSGQPLMSIVPLNDIWIVANYKETQLKRVRVGQPVEIRVDAYPEIKLEGAVQSIMAGSGAVFSLFPPENATGNYVKVVQRIPVKIVLDERSDSQVLRVGMSVVPTIDTTAAR
jgi:membrane fusion protein (multidrug efflux system)